MENLNEQISYLLTEAQKQGTEAGRAFAESFWDAYEKSYRITMASRKQKIMQELDKELAQTKADLTEDRTLILEIQTLLTQLQKLHDKIDTRLSTDYQEAQEWLNALGYKPE